MNPWLVLLALTVLAVLFVVVPVAAASLSYWRRPRPVQCPRADLEARISVDAGRATLGEVLGRPDLTVSRCSLWRILPRLRSCRGECLEPAAGPPQPAARPALLRDDATSRSSARPVHSEERRAS